MNAIRRSASMPRHDYLADETAETSAPLPPSAIPDIGGDAIPDSGTPTSALPVVGADGTAHNRFLPLRMGGKLFGGVRRLCCCVPK